MVDPLFREQASEDGPVAQQLHASIFAEPRHALARPLVQDAVLHLHHEATMVTRERNAQNPDVTRRDVFERVHPQSLFFKDLAVGLGMLYGRPCMLEVLEVQCTATRHRASLFVG